MIDVQKIYDEWLLENNDMHYKKRYQGQENGFMHLHQGCVCVNTTFNMWQE